MAGQKRQRVRAKRGPMTGSARLRADFMIEIEAIATV